ncbi:hypothetical protein E3Q05_02784 [Wallemia mellicola]|nr:hypothetical protein E3Q05_02784 [Wallemia mellicola]
MSSSRLPAKPATDKPNIAQQHKRKSAESVTNAPNVKLFIGNIPPSVNEYTLIKHFKTFGKIKKLDYLYHTSGPYEGRPRGYAFIEYESLLDATTAKELSHKRAFDGKLIVDTDNTPIKRRKIPSPEYTILSLQKSSTVKKSTDSRIQQIQDKLAEMDKK